MILASERFLYFAWAFLSTYVVALALNMDAHSLVVVTLLLLGAASTVATIIIVSLSSPAWDQYVDWILLFVGGVAGVIIGSSI